MSLIVDGREVTMVTIDGEGTKDIDDAIGVIFEEYICRFFVAIANVASVIKKGSSACQLAIEKGFTRYFGNWSEPMIDKSLSEDQLSLVRGKKREAMIIEFDIASTNEITEKIYFDNLIIDHNLNYQEVIEIVDNRSPHKLKDILLACSNLTRIFAQKRKNNHIDNDFIVSEEGKEVILNQEGIAKSYLIVQEAMIFTNIKIAEFCIKNDINILFRNHKADYVVDIFTNGKQKLKINIGKAKYEVVATGHHGLNLPYYTHGTSPLRRAADLVNQQILMAIIKGEPMPYSIEELEEIAKKINTKRNIYEQNIASQFFLNLDFI